MMNYRRHTHGFAILYAVLTASLVLTIGLAIFNITLKEFTLSSQVRDSQFAFYSADTGLECALYWDLEHPGYVGSIFGAYTNTLSNGLVAYWKFDEGSGDEAADTAGHGHTGTLYNLSSDWVPGRLGTALAFNDTTSKRVEIPDSDALFVDNTITITAWVQRGSDTTTDAIYSDMRTSDSPPVEYGFEFAANSTQMVFYTTDERSGTFVGATGDIGSYDLDEWIHVAVTWDGSTARFYLDGNSESSAPFAHSMNPFAGTRNVGIGRRIGGGAPFDGIIDEVRVYDRALKDSEIESLAELTTSGGFYIPENVMNVWCNEGDVSDTWIQTEPDIPNGAATTTFTVQVEEDSNRCAEVTVAKAFGLTRIVSRGYNTCDTDNPRRIERAIRAVY